MACTLDSHPVCILIRSVMMIVGEDASVRVPCAAADWVQGIEVSTYVSCNMLYLPLLTAHLAVALCKLHLGYANLVQSSWLAVKLKE